ncbi:MAG: endonuclease VII domain-containing protein [Pseudomonadota bacterium]
MATLETKVCTGCRVPKSLDLFAKDNGKKDGRQSRCKDCQKDYREQHKETGNEYTRQWRKAHPGYDAAQNLLYRQTNPGLRAQQDRRKRLKKKYNLTPEEFDALIAAQGGRCAICKTDTPGGSGTWHVDHNHETGRVRGLLCVRCNPMLGLALDDPLILIAALEYLERADRDADS